MDTVPSSRSAIERLPFELHDLIAVFVLEPLPEDCTTQRLPSRLKKQACALRLTCRSFSMLDTPLRLLFDRLHVFATADSISNFTHIVKSPKLAPRVRAIRFYQPIIHKRYCVEGQFMVEIVQQHLRTSHSMRGIPPAAQIPSDQMLQAFHTYRTLYDEQEALLRDGYENHIAALLRGLPRLIHVEIMNEHSSTVQPLHRDRVDLVRRINSTVQYSRTENDDTNGYLARHNRGVLVDRFTSKAKITGFSNDAHVLRILKAIGISGVVLRTLKSPALTVEFRLPGSLDESFESTRLMLNSLSSLHVNLIKVSRINTFVQQTSNTGNFDSSVPGEYRSRDFSTSLGAFLTQATSLKELVLEPCDEVQRSRPITLSNSLHAPPRAQSDIWSLDSINWNTILLSNLKKLVLRKAQLPTDDLLSVLQRNGETLEHIELDDLILTPDLDLGWGPVHATILEHCTSCKYFFIEIRNRAGTEFSAIWSGLARV